MVRRITGVLVVAAAAGCADAGSTQPEMLFAPAFSHEDGGAHGADLHFKAHLTGAEEAPNPVDTRAQGQVKFRLSKDGNSLHYKLIVANIRNVTQAHIHLGQPGAAGGVVVWLYPQCRKPATCATRLIPGRSQGPLAQGTITLADLRGALNTAEFSDLIENIRAGNAYANVHTTQNPPGEIRGQL
jgi:hypothetical protein